MTKRNRTLLIIAGMHRSGTSLLAALTQQLGASLGEGLIPAPEEDNKLGYFEPQAVVDLHEALFAAMDMRSDDCTLFPKDWQKKHYSLQAERAITEWLSQFSEKDELVVVKDPRICRFIPLWQNVAARQGFTIKVILPVRNPLEIADSVAKRSQEYQHLHYSLLWWAVHLLEAEHATRALPRVFYNYEQLLRSPVETLDAITQTLDIEWPHFPDSIIDTISTLVDPSLHRNHASKEALKEKDQLGIASRLYTLLDGRTPPTPEERLAMDKLFVQVRYFLSLLPQAPLRAHGSREEINEWQHAMRIFHTPWWKRPFIKA